MSANSEKVTKDIVKDASKLDDEYIKDSVTETSGENKDDPTTENKKTTENDNIKSEIQTPVLNPTTPIILPPKTKGSEPFATEEIDDSIFIKIIDRSLLTTLQSFVRSEDLYNVNPKISAHELFTILPQLRTFVGQDPQETYQEFSDQVPPSDNQINSPIKQLVDWLEKEFDSTLKQINNMTDKSEISYKHLWYLFPNETQIYAELHGKVCGARVKRCEYKSYGSTQLFIVTGEIIDSNGYEFVNVTKNWYIDHFVGVLNIDKLPVVPLQKECTLRDELVKRGKKFEMLAIGPHYLRYFGKFFRQSWFGPTYYKGDGRIMIDASTFGLTNPNYDMGLANYNPATYMYNHNNTLPKPSNKGDSSKKKVREVDLYMCSPTFFGFSFMAKKWGQFYVDQVDEIKFDDDAFDNLIMDTNKKEIIISLVNSELSGGLDLISGKGGGCIFLLHGPPGVGKTLTAEAISEYLHRPLYAVSVGELGVTPKELEDKLSEILEVASVWNAVILIDEVDIFLEQRSKNDVNRNALVGIFLRLLEYHQGILFLTTNRVESFDKAFYSRISIILRYDDLDELARAQVWRTFLDRADGKDKSQVNIDKLKQRQLNGREIKTAVRMAKALATKSDSDAVITTLHLEKILDISVKNL
ncbi:P-loop containing nucleoside triphosphate hydrolase protein [Gigaspora margarita]|uniref:P-loop containing nucleoside triphosphate hydrolase protein n=1 Tax=Gigaspora margarita TaxID=4874 RepID=A0A8H4EQL7_GIGMA|nr:P-loop containing nucleoside triphosphate hydrolase protein [Gigaspora margarita]